MAVEQGDRDHFDRAAVLRPEEINIGDPLTAGDRFADPCRRSGRKASASTIAAPLPDEYATIAGCAMKKAVPAHGRELRNGGTPCWR